MRPNRTMKISFRITDEYGSNVKSVKELPIDRGIAELRGILNTKMNRKSGKKTTTPCVKDLMRGL